MSDTLNFSADEFLKMSSADRALRCRLLARRACALAIEDTKFRVSYTEIAKQWSSLADELERHASG